MSWARHVGAHTVLESPLGTIVIDEERAPLVSVSRWSRGGVVERLVTREGEYAAIETTDGRYRAVVLGDRHFVSLDGRPNHETGAAFAIAFREVVEAVTLHLGIRKRALVYVPPAGWLAIPRGLGTEWIAPQHPRGLTRVRVYPALPLEIEVESVLTALVTEVVNQGNRVELGEQTPRPAGCAVDAILIAADGARLWRTWALSRSGPYLCTLRLDCADEASHREARSVFDAIAASVEALPVPDRAASDASLWPM